MEVAEALEIVLAVFMVVILIIMICRTVIFETPTIFTEGATIHHFLEEALMLTIAIEFTKMLCMHTPETLIEVLLFALSRHMIVESLPPLQNLVIVLCIVILFAARKFLFTGHDQKAGHGGGFAHDMDKLRESNHHKEEAREAALEQKRLERAKKEIRAKEGQ